MNKRSVGKFLTALACISLFSVTAEAATRSQIKRMVINEASSSNVPVPLALAVAKVESDFNDKALSSAGARGVMQIMPATGRHEFGLSAEQLWDPRLNIRTGLRFLEQLHSQYGQRWDLALSHYNGGTLKGRGQHASAHGYTKKYVSTVLKWRNVYSEQASLWQPAAPEPAPRKIAKIRPLSEGGDLSATIALLQAEVRRREDDYYDAQPQQSPKSRFREYHDTDEAGDRLFEDRETETAMIGQDKIIFRESWHERDAKILPMPRRPASFVRRQPEFLFTGRPFKRYKFKRGHPVFRNRPGRKFH